MARDESLDLEAARARFEEATDFTMAVEEEFAILDPETLDLAHGFERMFEESQENETLADSVRGELIDTEIEIRSGRSESFAEMRERQLERRRLLFGLAAREHRLLAACGHPSVGRLPRPGDHRHAPLPPSPGRARLGRPAQQHLEPPRPRRGSRRRPGGRRLRLAPQRPPGPAGDLRQLAVPRRPRHRPRLGPDADLHPDLPALRPPRPVRGLELLCELRRPARADQLDR